MKWNISLALTNFITNGKVFFLVVNIVSLYQRTPLHMAAEGGHTDAVKFLVKKQTNINTKDVDRVSAWDMILLDFSMQYYWWSYILVKLTLFPGTWQRAHSPPLMYKTSLLHKSMYISTYPAISQSLWIVGLQSLSKAWLLLVMYLDKHHCDRHMWYMAKSV